MTVSSDDDSNLEEVGGAKRARNWTLEEREGVKKVTEDELAFAAPQRSHQTIPPPPTPPTSGMCPGGIVNCRQFWKAGDFEGAPDGNWDMSSGGFDHLRVHPKFLHTNATSHKWALGAFAELLDNAVDEVPNGATYVLIDMLKNNKDGTRMLLFEDDGGGMNPEKMRQCMSLGYSAKSKLEKTIGQYGNGFKTSTMRLGADVIVFSRRMYGETSITQSIGLLSYSFLRSTGKEEIVVPMLDYVYRDQNWDKIVMSSLSDWEKNLETIIQWSPFSSEEELLFEFGSLTKGGTRIIIYNLWEDDQGLLELDFDADYYDIQLRGANRDEKRIRMASKFPNSRHFLTYKHSLRSYISILYLEVPPKFHILLRGSEVDHHTIVTDMMQIEKNIYRPQIGAEIFSTKLVDVTIGFVKDAKHNIDVQGFNVYHKNRLITPFWRVWSPTGIDGRGVIGVLEANFIEPAHDKQGFERTTNLSRLEAKLMTLQKNYWNNNCHKIGYVPKQDKKFVNESTPVNAHEGPYPSGFQSPGFENIYRNPYPNLDEEDNGVCHAWKDGALEELRREKERCKALEAQLKSEKAKMEEMKKEQDNLIETFLKERDRRDEEEAFLRNQLEKATKTIVELRNKIRMLEGYGGPSWRC